MFQLQLAACDQEQYERHSHVARVAEVCTGRLHASCCRLLHSPLLRCSHSKSEPVPAERIKPWCHKRLACKLHACWDGFIPGSSTKENHLPPAQVSPAGEDVPKLQLVGLEASPASQWVIVYTVHLLTDASLSDIQEAFLSLCGNVCSVCSMTQMA